jgi:predicted  nucleic acid-binding Zn ribbon protein
MYDAQIHFDLQPTADRDEISDAVSWLLGALRMNGQICGKEWPIILGDGSCAIYVMLPAADALSPDHHNSYVRKIIAERLPQAGVSEPRITILGEDLDGDDPCPCGTPPSYVLYTTYTCLESPVRCGGCFLPIPLYSLPKTNHDEYSDVISWQSNYQACDTLQMNCQVLERAATREISRLESSLSQEGLRICREWAESTGVPFYYYLYRYGARSLAQERKRLCPSCGGPWLLGEPWHLFDFKCDRCRLLSNIAWDVRG